MAIDIAWWPKNTPVEGMHKYPISASQLTAVKQEKCLQMYKNLIRVLLKSDTLP